MGKPDLKPLSQFRFLPAAFLKSSVSVVNFRCLLPDKTLVSVCVHAYSDFFFPSPLGPCVLAEDRTEQREREESTHMPVARPSTFLINVLKERKHTHTRKKKNPKLGSLSAAVSFTSTRAALPVPVWPPRYANRYVRISRWIITIHYPVLMSGLILHVHNPILVPFLAGVKGESWVNTIYIGRTR